MALSFFFLVKLTQAFFNLTYKNLPNSALSHKLHSHYSIIVQFINTSCTFREHWPRSRNKCLCKLTSLIIRNSAFYFYYRYTGERFFELLMNNDILT
ncbi:hypothetical protein RCL_jg20045.t1 [Rhizophagus clarus]|uniref:Uncharacterized protein n=1 Tax=Rhizophagus clarus TaxID=94130 RepID=A0A8H3LB39_9GLOM|nr:hypothetical protein RCL_jg20045.t1 [Rhizophagus clarus]